mgnify:CR=1 FL=1
MTTATFPQLRLRRLREKAPLRQLVRETEVSPTDFIYPIFVKHGADVREEIHSMPNIYHISLDNLLEEATEVAKLNIPGVILFGLPSQKDETGSAAYHEHGIIQEAIHVIKQAIPDLLVVTDVCLCQYTDHGHCGVIGDGVVDNDLTLDLYAKTAVSHAKAGADIDHHLAGYHLCLQVVHQHVAGPPGICFKLLCIRGPVVRRGGNLAAHAVGLFVLGLDHLFLGFNRGHNSSPPVAVGGQWAEFAD